MFCSRFLRNATHLTQQTLYFSKKPSLLNPLLTSTKYQALTYSRRFLTTTIKKKHAGGGGGTTGKSSIPGLEQTDRSFFDIIKFLLNHAFLHQPIRNRAIVTVSLVGLVASKLLNVQVPQMFKHAINNFTEYQQEKINLKSMSQEQQDLVIKLTMISAAALGSIVMFGAISLTAEFLNQLRNALFATVSQSSIRRVSTDLFRKIHNMPMSWHLSKQTGLVMKAIDRGTKGSNTVLKSTVFNIFPTIFELGLVMSILNAQCGLEFSAVALGTVGAYSAYTVGTTSWRTPFRIQMNKADSLAGNLAVDSLTNYETVKLFNNEKFECDRYDKQMEAYEKASLKVEWSLAGLNFGQQAILTSGMTVLMYMAGQGIVDGSMTVGDLVMVNGLLFNLSKPLGFLGSVYRDMNQAVLDMKTMMAIMDMPTPSDTKNAIDCSQIIPDSNHQPTITFKNVSFKYDGSNQIFKNLSLTIPAGKKVAIVGGSGSGKSTIVRLLYRFYEPESGEILINGHNINNIKLDSMRQKIGVVPQDCVLFHDTIEHNIKYGGNMENSEVTDEMVIESAKKADLHESILKMKNGYKTVVGERGLKLSGGEKQRLAIARAMLKQPNIIVYDEATSSLDSITEMNILKALKTVTDDRTTIVIAHRLSTIVDCDEIVVLGDGGVLQQGSHDDLLKNENGQYFKMWASQH